MSSAPDTPKFAARFLRPMPDDGVGRAKRLAADLAEGTLMGFWTEVLKLDPSGAIRMWPGRFLESYLQEIWTDVIYPQAESRPAGAIDFTELLVKLIGMGYLSQMANRSYVASEKAYDLLGTHSVDVFIAYSVNETSSVAMLVWSELQRRGYSPFLDIRNLSGGDEWHELLEKKVKASDVFVVLLGPRTLESKYVCEEIRWASEAGRAKLIPIALKGFDVSGLSDELKFLSEKNIIWVRDNTSVEFLSMLNQLLSSISLIG